MQLENYDEIMLNFEEGMTKKIDRLKWLESVETNKLYKNQMVNIAKEVATSIETTVNQTADTEENKKKDKDEENTTPLYSFSGQDENGKYTFKLSATDSNSKEFINKFGESVKANIKTKIQERIDFLTADMNRELKKKEEKPDHTAEIAVLNEYLKMEDFWVLDYAEELAEQDTSKLNTDVNIGVIITGSDNKEAIVSFSFGQESETTLKTVIY